LVYNWNQKCKMWFRTFVAFVSLCVYADAFTVGSRISGFGGTVVVSGASNVATVEMKKGKANVPPQMRQQLARQKEMAAMRQQMMAASKPGPDGLPVFNLFVRTPRANMWYPCGSFKGDDRSKALCTTYRDQGFMSGMAKKQLDSGIGSSLFRDLEKLKDSIIRGYPQLKKARKELQFGYKIAFEGLDENVPVTPIEPKEVKGLIDNIKSLF